MQRTDARQFAFVGVERGANSGQAR